MIPSIFVLLRKKLRMKKLVTGRKLAYVALAFVIFAFINAVLFYVAENVLGGNESITFWRALYWSIVTMATVGYGDVVPSTSYGSIVAVETIIIGIAIFTMLVSTLAEEFMNRSMRKNMGLGRLKKTDILVIGDSESCKEVINELLINLPNARISWLMPQPPQKPPEDVEFVSGDPSEEETLKRAAADRARKIIICLKDDSKAVHTVLMLRKINKSAQVIAVASNDKVKELLKEAGADFITPLRLIGRVLASAAFEPSVAEFIDEITTARGVADLVERAVPKEFSGKELREFVNHLIASEGVRKYVPLAIKRETDLIVAPDPAEKIKEGDKIVLLKTYRKA